MNVKVMQTCMKMLNLFVAIIIPVFKKLCYTQTKTLEVF